MTSLLKTTWKAVTSPFVCTYTIIKGNCTKIAHSKYSSWLPEVVKDYAPALIAVCATAITGLFLYMLLSEFLFEEVSVADRVVEQPIVNMQIVTPTREVLQGTLSEAAAKTLEIIKKPVFNITEQAVKCFPAPLINVTQQLVELDVKELWNRVDDARWYAQTQDTCYDTAHYNARVSDALRMVRTLSPLINRLAEALSNCHVDQLWEEAKQIVKIGPEIMQVWTNAHAGIVEGNRIAGCFNPETFQVLMDLLHDKGEILSDLFNGLKENIEVLGSIYKPVGVGA